MFKRVLLCHDGSAAGRRALRRGADLAVLVGAEVYILIILSDNVVSGSALAAAGGTACLVNETQEYQAMLQQSVATLSARGVNASGHLVRGNTIEVIVDLSRKLNVDLVVVGHYPSSSGKRWWSGSERASLAERVNCCVFIAMGEDFENITSP